MYSRAWLSECVLELPPRRTLKRHCPDEALPPGDPFLQQTKEAGVFRRAPAVREVVTGHRLHTVSEPRHFPSSALRQGGHRCATQGVPGVGERPRPGRPATGPGAWAAPRDRLVDHEPRQHGSRHSQGRGQARAAVHARQPGGHLRRERVREVLKKTRTAK
jgi:hypothetical protein